MASEPATAATAITAQPMYASTCARRRSPSWNSAATNAPPIRPPMCPPQEMPGIVKLMTRLRRISVPTPLCMSGILRARISTAAAPITPKIAPEAPTVRLWGETSSAPNEPVSSETA